MTSSTTTILHRLYDWAKEAPHSPAQRFKEEGEWKTLSAQEYLDRVFHLALYLESIGLTAEDTGAIFSYNSKEWVQMELALLLIRSKSVGLYPNSTSKDICYILEHTGSVLLAVQNKDYMGRILKDGHALPPSIRFVLSLDGDTSVHPQAISFQKAIEEGKRIAQKENKKIEDYLAKLDPLAPAFMIYTSGTTGKPKGAVLSHDNLTFTSDEIDRRWKLPTSHGTLFSFLPLCHIAEKLHSIGVGISKRYLVSYCTQFENLIQELGEVEPTLLLCVPRVWEKMMEGVVSKVVKGKGIKKHLASWALGVGKRLAETKYTTGGSPIDRALYPLADRLVLGKVKKALGLGKAQLLASGAAPLPAHVAKWFRGLNLEIYECYGLTETTGMVSITLPEVECAGTVGKPLEGCEFKLEEDGEICTKGRHVFLGYHHDPENTAASLKEGWFHTGDIGAWTKEGLLKIVGRKREIMKTSGGKMVAPVPIEEMIKEAPFISQVCMVGDNHKYFSALVTLSDEELERLKKTPALVKDGVVIDPALIQKVEAEVSRVNRTLASFEQIKKFTILDREFSIEHGEMTPTMKMKRSIVEKNFKHLIEKMYS